MASEQANTSTSTSSTAPANPQVTATVNKLLGGLGTAFDKGAPPTPNYSTFAPAGQTSQNAWAQSLQAANNPAFSSAVNGAIGSFGKAASGNDYGMNDPGYATLRANAGNDAMVMLNGQANAAGRLGGGLPNKALGEGVTNALAGLDYANFQNDRNWQAQSLPLLGQAYGLGQQPAATVGAVGAAQDANQQGILSGNYDLAQRQNNNQTDWLAKLSSILSGNAQTSGNTTTQTNSTPATPWWQSALGIAGSLL